MKEPPANGGPPSAIVVSVGDELLLGQTLNTNGSWLSGRLSDMGFRVIRRIVVADGLQEIGGEVRVATEHADVVVVTGGLGPTPDDLTREAVADALGFDLSPDTEIRRRLQERSRSRGLSTLPSGVERMALVPEGAMVLSNPLGAAPGLALETGSSMVVLLPGIPREMMSLFSHGLEDLLLRRFSGRLRPAVHRTIHTSGIPESRLASEIGELLGEEPLGEDMESVTIAFLPHVAGVRVRLTARTSHQADEVERTLDGAEEILEPVLSPHRYEASSGELSEALGRALLASGLTLAVAESCTGGLIAKGLTDHPGSSGFFKGGIVAYSNAVKKEILGVPDAVLELEGAVSEEVAEAMAKGAAERLDADAGIGVTGIAGPEGGTPQKPVGTVCIAVVLNGRAEVRTARFLGDREDIRARAAAAANLLLLRMVGERSR